MRGSEGKAILVVGAGVTGCSAAALLRRYTPNENCRIEVWEKTGECGGRLDVARLAGGLVANQGAQRLHVAQTDGATARNLASELVMQGVLREAEEGVFSPGQSGALSAVCHSLLEQAQATKRFGVCVRAIRKSGSRWVVSTHGEKATTVFDAIIFTGCTAEVECTHGDLDSLLAPLQSRLRGVKYSRLCCASLMLGPGEAADAVRGLFDGRETASLAVSIGPIKEIVLQVEPSHTGIRRQGMALVAVSTDAFGAGVQGLRQTHSRCEQGAEDLRKNRELLVILQQSVCSTLAERLGGWSKEELMSAVIDGKLYYWKFARVVRGLTGSEDALPIAPCLALCEPRLHTYDRPNPLLPVLFFSFRSLLPP